MKKLITTCVLVAAGSMMSFAQSTTTTTKTTKTTTKTSNVNTPSAEQIAERRAQMYKKQYNLNDNQYKAVYMAELDNVRDDQQARANGGQPGPGQSQQMEMARDQKFQNAMTPDQYAKYKANKAPVKAN